MEEEDEVVHLVQSLHDVTARCTAIWCEGANPYHAPSAQLLEFVTCRPCLRAAIEHGRECEARLEQIAGDG